MYECQLDLVKIDRSFPLLTCSAAPVEIPAGPRSVSVDQLASKIADLKKAAKRSPSHLSVSSLS